LTQRPPTSYLSISGWSRYALIKKPEGFHPTSLPLLLL
jgi:hypothetical protein